VVVLTVNKFNLERQKSPNAQPWATPQGNGVSKWPDCLAMNTVPLRSTGYSSYILV